MFLAIALLAALEIWQYPALQPRHEVLRACFAQAMAKGRPDEMEKAAADAVKTFPEDPTWRYNLACARARQRKADAAFDTLEEAMDLGFRDARIIAKDADWAELAGEKRFRELLEYAGEIADKPILTGPLAAVEATGVFGRQVAIGPQNLAWNFESGCCDVKMRLSVASAGGNTGDLYVNRDGGHSMLKTDSFPALTVVKFDSELKNHGLSRNIPNMLFPYPVFGNCSTAYVHGDYWRSLPRSLMTTDSAHLKVMAKLYLSNQVWVFPACADTRPIGSYGDVFPGLMPYCIATEGRSWSDLPYLEFALEASRSLQSDVKREIVKRGLLAPTIITLIRRSLHSVTNDAAYLSPVAHPTAFPSPSKVNRHRLAASAAALTVAQISPLAIIAGIRVQAPEPAPTAPELAYATPCAWCFVLRDMAEDRSFVIAVKGAQEFHFAQTHGSGSPAKIETVSPGVAKVSVNTRDLSSTNRMDIAIFARNPGTPWGAPSYVSISRLDAKAPYNDPFFVRRAEAKGK